MDQHELRVKTPIEVAAMRLIRAKLIKPEEKPEITKTELKAETQSIATPINIPDQKPEEQDDLVEIVRIEKPKSKKVKALPTITAATASTASTAGQISPSSKASPKSSRPSKIMISRASRSSE